jgi:hypothetical protein
LMTRARAGAMSRFHVWGRGTANPSLGNHGTSTSRYQYGMGGCTSEWLGWVPLVKSCRHGLLHQFANMLAGNAWY